MASNKRSANFRSECKPGIKECTCPRCGKHHAYQMDQEAIDVYRIEAKRFMVFCDGCAMAIAIPTIAEALRKVAQSCVGKSVSSATPSDRTSG